MSKLEKNSIAFYPEVREKVKAYIDSYRKEDNEIIQNFISKGLLEEITPMSYRDQQKITKVLAQEKGEESDYDSDVPVEDEVRFSRRLFNYIKIQDHVQLPPQRDYDKGKKTLFIEIDDLIIHTFIPDENIGYIANAATKDADKTLFLEDATLNIMYYERDYLHEFLEYIDKNFEPILFTTSQRLYADFIIKQFDPEDKIFRHRLYQNSCYMLEKSDEDLLEFIKDINQFLHRPADGDKKQIGESGSEIPSEKRNPKDCLILDTKALNFILNPDNCIVCEEYTAAYAYSQKGLKDRFLLDLIDDLKEFKEAEDVRPLSRTKFGVIENLFSSKLV